MPRPGKKKKIGTKKQRKALKKYVSKRSVGKKGQAPTVGTAKVGTRTIGYAAKKPGARKVKAAPRYRGQKKGVSKRKMGKRIK